MWFTMIKKEVFDEIGFLDENMNIFSQDLDFGYRALKEGYVTMFVNPPVRHAWCQTTSMLENQEDLKAEAKEVFKTKWGIDHDSA
jgi:cellulose synthase/poly-beta-1,6-N-acetylglucosamine synthase-like glycosyltransferase